MSKPAPHPNLLFFITDQQRADTLAPGSVCYTPHLDRLADRGARFESCYAPNPICAPVRASLFTGLLPHNHGMVDNPHTVEAYRADLKPGLPFWPRDLEQAGYRTAYFGKWHVDRSLRLENFGFHEYDTEEEDYQGYRAYRRQLGLPEKAPPPVDTVRVEHKGYRPFVLSGISPEPPEAMLEEYIVQRGIQFIHQQAARRDSRPWALTLSTLAPHDPYIAPRPYFDLYDPLQIPQPSSFHDDLEGRPAIYQRIQQVWKDLEWDQFAQAIACYYAFCSMIDAQIGRVLTALEQTGQAENTLVIYVSDHGDYMGAHRLMLKGIPAYDQAYRVPLLMAGPGIPSGRTIFQRVNHLDLAASILPLLGLQSSPSSGEFSKLALGRSLLPLLGDDSQEHAAWSSQHFAECHGQRFAYTQRILWWQDYKYVFNGFDQDELYNLGDDPDEMHNLAQDPSMAGVIEEMAARMWEVMRQTGDKNMTEAEYGMFRFLPVGPQGRLTS